MFLRHHILSTIQYLLSNTFLYIRICCYSTRVYVGRSLYYGATPNIALHKRCCPSNPSNFPGGATSRTPRWVACRPQTALHLGKLPHLKPLAEPGGRRPALGGRRAGAAAHSGPAAARSSWEFESGSRQGAEGSGRLGVPQRGVQTAAPPGQIRKSLVGSAPWIAL